MRRACLSNLGTLLYLTGDLDHAVDHFERAIATLPSSGESSSAILDSLARVRLAQGRIEECDLLVERIESSMQRPEDRILHAYRHNLLTRTELLARQGRINEALDSAETLMTVAREAGDDLLGTRALLTKAELLQLARRIPEMLTVLESAVERLACDAPDLHAQYERILACSLARCGEVGHGRRHFERAQRVYESIRDAPGLSELARCWEEARESVRQGSVDLVPSTEADGMAPSADTQNIVQCIAALMLHASRPELLAREMVHLLNATGSVRSAAALARCDGHQTEVLAAVGVLRDSWSAMTGTDRTIPIGVARGRHIDIVLEPITDIESRATVNALLLLLTAIHELEGARLEREERVSLWPVEEVPLQLEGAVISGRTRDLILVARRIAKTPTTVLITGESGTGKEILGRAVHAFSDRATRAFVPVNCSAVPREMLESQLFGYRRGAFTGADRDSPGLIRSAHTGTLFLDEIGELGLDLQPKLLRFLESHEICPLGEAMPLTVDVRVIAATNSNLQDLVKEGRFREDLFYRLNVVKLETVPLRERRDEIPSLASHFLTRAAAAFGRGQLRISEDLMEHLMLYRWPGNVRELDNAIRRMAALAEPDAVLTPDDLPDDIRGARDRPAIDRRDIELLVPLHGRLQSTLETIEREMIQAALRENRGRVDLAAKALGISRKGLYLKRQRLGL